MEYVKDPFQIPNIDHLCYPKGNRISHEKTGVIGTIEISYLLLYFPIHIVIVQVRVRTLVSHAQQTKSNGSAVVELIHPSPSPAKRKWRHVLLDRRVRRN